MGFELEVGETVEAGLRRVVDEQLDKSLEELGAADERTADEAVHSVRKRIKRVRAVLRLARQDIGEAAFARENNRLRGAAGSVGQARDAHVLVQTLAGLEDAVERRAFAAARKRLTARRRAVRERVLGEGAGLETVAAVLRVARARLGTMRLQKDGWGVIRRGLRRTYGAGRAAMKEAYAVRPASGGGEDAEAGGAVSAGGVGASATAPAEDASKATANKSGRAPARGGAAAGAVELPGAPAGASEAEAFHRWRRRTKDLWHHVEVVEGMWPAILAPLAEEVHRLADLLGREHDLAVLRQVVEAEEVARGRPAAWARPVLDAIAAHRAALQAQARDVGARLFAERPGAFVRRLGRYWRAWRAEGAEAVREEGGVELSGAIGAAEAEAAAEAAGKAAAAGKADAAPGPKADDGGDGLPKGPARGTAAPGGGAAAGGPANGDGGRTGVG